jgi:predicted amidophosphoribosyltransferase
VHGLKYRDRTDLAPMMAVRCSGWGREWSNAAMRYCPSPASVACSRASSTRQRNWRGIPGTLLRIRRTRQQVGLGVRAREDNVRGAFALAQGHEGSSASGLCSWTTSALPAPPLPPPPGLIATPEPPTSRF